ncbi:glycosyltransferase [Phycicoccus flavus]|uniref:Glycosyl transferase n=1 Tax=Phycicoccus flavus TaxID=2502783 RepID=A0A8T6QZ50_9MICO|nr:glycosyltransferase [Phycicoccus flavus]NHA66440.1 glycosyl transferase [Phycicoccus flavus]
MIGWYVHHQGRGHATRAAAVAAHLRHPVTGLGSGPPPEGWTGHWVDLEPDDLDPAPADATARGVLHHVPRRDAGLAARSARVAAWAAAERPALLVVDVSVEVTLLARLCGVPVVVAVLPGDRSDPVHALAHDVAEALLAPWPAGTHEVAWPSEWAGKVWTVGAMSRFDGRPVRPPARRDAPRVLLLWGAGGRSTTDGQVAAARAATPGWEWTECSDTGPEELWESLLDADVVVTHGGQNAVAEVAAARRPAVVVAQPRPFDEQAWTARCVDALGLAVGLAEWPDADAWPALLERARTLGGAGWERWSPGDAAADAARRLDAIADDLADEPTDHPTGRTAAPRPDRVPL